MASKSSPLLLIALIHMLVSLGLAQAAHIILPPPDLPIPRLSPGGILPVPEVPIPTIPGTGAPEIQQCWASIINIGGCYAEIFRAFQSGQAASFTVGSTCCKAVKDLSSTCWPRMFPVNPLFPPLLQNYCSRYINPLPAVAPKADVPHVPYVAPAPEEDSPVAPAPEEGAPAPEEEDVLEFETRV